MVGPLFASFADAVACQAMGLQVSVSVLHHIANLLMIAQTGIVCWIRS